MTYVINYYLAEEQENTTVDTLASFARLAEYVREQNKNVVPDLLVKYTLSYDLSQVPDVTAGVTEREGKIIYKSTTDVFEYRFVTYNIISSETDDPYDTIVDTLDIPTTFNYGDLVWMKWFENAGFEDVKDLLYAYIETNFDKVSLLDANDFFSTQSSKLNILIDLVQAKRLLDSLVN